MEGPRWILSNYDDAQPSDCKFQATFRVEELHPLSHPYHQRLIQWAMIGLKNLPNANAINSAAGSESKGGTHALGSFQEVRAVTFNSILQLASISYVEGMLYLFSKFTFEPRFDCPSV